MASQEKQNISSETRDFEANEEPVAEAVLAAVGADAKAAVPDDLPLAEVLNETLPH